MPGSFGDVWLMIMHLLVGVFVLGVGGWMVLTRERLTARARLRAGSTIHAPMGYLVLGGMLFSSA